jgi:hypothetical protein
MAAYKIPIEKKEAEEITKAQQKEQSNKAWKTVNFTVAYIKWGSPANGLLDLYQSFAQNMQEECKRQGLTKFVYNIMTAPSSQLMEFMDRFSMDPGEELKNLVTMKSYPALAEAWKRAYGDPSYQNIRALDVANAAYLLEGAGMVAMAYPAAKGVSAGVRGIMREGGVAAQEALEQVAANSKIAAKSLENAQVKLRNSPSKLFKTLGNEFGCINPPAADLVMLSENAGVPIAQRLGTLLERPGMAKIRPDVVKLLESTITEIEGMGFSKEQTRKLNEVLVRFVTSTAEARGIPVLGRFEERVREFKTALMDLRENPFLISGKGRFAPLQAYEDTLNTFQKEMPAWRKDPRKMAEKCLKISDKEGTIIHDHMQGLRPGESEMEWKYWGEFGKQYYPDVFTWKTVRDPSIFVRRSDKARDLLYRMIDEAIQAPTDVFAYVHSEFGSREVALGVVRKYPLIIDQKPTIIGMHLYFDHAEKGLFLRTSYLSSDFSGIEMQMMRRDLMRDVADILKSP